MILDLYSNLDSLQERIGCSRRLLESQVPSVIMADDGLRSTAFELVRDGSLRLLPQAALHPRPEDHAQPGL